MSLLRRDESVLLVVDTQEGFYGQERCDVDRATFAEVVARVAWVAGVARALGVPVVVTEEDPADERSHLAARRRAPSRRRAGARQAGLRGR